ncbi:hypothetical protein LIER_06135 [Lithospermum erythrorhizon]|uniref:Uncharacterized protein n=1 Tax=Lithospermum erythrorhizon TaxID=34254 RepID=A0AAV3P5U2_LITER
MLGQLLYGIWLVRVSLRWWYLSYLKSELFRVLSQKDCPISPLNHQLLQAMFGDRTLKDTPPSSLIRNAFLVRVVDLATLRQEVSDDIFLEIDEYPNQSVPAGAAEVGHHLLANGSSTPTTVSSSTNEGGFLQTVDGPGKDWGFSRFH